MTKALLERVRWTWRGFFGRPDGHLVKLRCWLLGHRWSPCVDECCDGETEWCGWCLGTRFLFSADVSVLIHARSVDEACDLLSEWCDKPENAGLSATIVKARADD